MATKKQKTELIETLKFTPVTYQVIINGYGGEIAMGRVSRDIINYFKKNHIDLDEYASSWGEPGDDDYIEVPEDLQPFSQGSWYDCDNIEHNSGAEFGGAWITVYDEKGDQVWEQELGHDLADLGCEISCFCSEDIDDYCDDENGVFVGQNFEKGCFFEADLELKQPFEPSKFKFTYSEVAGWPVLNMVEYEDEELDGSNGYSTTGKSSSYNFYYRDQEGEVIEYDASSGDDSEIESSTNKGLDSFQELANTIAAKAEASWINVSIKPPAKGDYECKFSQGVWPLGDVRQATWTGRSWKENGKKAPEMIAWRTVGEE